jgi:hypothetical protein
MFVSIPFALSVFFFSPFSSLPSSFSFCCRPLSGLVYILKSGSSGEQARIYWRLRTCAVAWIVADWIDCFMCATQSIPEQSPANPGCKTAGWLRQFATGARNRIDLQQVYIECRSGLYASSLRLNLQSRTPHVMLVIGPVLRLVAKPWCSVFSSKRLCLIRSPASLSPLPTNAAMLYAKLTGFQCLYLLRQTWFTEINC